MTRLPKLLIAGTAAVTLLASGLALAGAGREARRHDGSRILSRIAHRLNLTDGQRTRMREIVAKHWSAGLGDAATRARLARRTLKDAMNDPAADEATIRDAARKAGAAAEDLAVMRHQTYVDAFAVLTPEQQEKAKSLREQRRARRDRRFEEIDGALRGR